MIAQPNSKGGLINMAAFLSVSRSNGPGRRAVLWVQGCFRNCPGCFNQDMQEFREKQVIAVPELVERILASEDIEGVTFSGGEPFAQAQALAELAEQLTARGLNIAIFTGYTVAELTAATDPAWQRLLAAADLLIAGPYEQDLPAQDYLVGSANQQLVFLTEKLKQHPDVVTSQGQTLEVIVDAAGKVTITGLTGKL
ncbi:4Fe-4S single cluster domain-containing protein [Sporomusa sp. KB1]|jgi:anaerobic ribonucleoside-triphosphate reductase activating protein|uniref:4Fe-4S single cluster domain-containing protein n=1 Tax=Sporomusa sp. KB1 TaxID=943346 RepID=UPI0011A24325|nr:4Fe-4S single cluster domain-containing protein [Sporomusa sp. KB1]TWH46739.1 anaerobic ribonucleoside-triphosphate reductase activating protein [Sporomusa sp. KB1]